MEPSGQGDNARLAALCSQLRRLWTAKPIEVWEEEPLAEKIEECKLSLIGKIVTNSFVNLSAF